VASRLRVARHLPGLEGIELSLRGSGGTAAASRQGALRGCKWAFVFAGRFDNLSRRRNMMQGTSRATRPSPDPVSLFDLKTNATQVSEDAILIHLLPGSEHKIVV
jgi:hypothetical protein